MAVDMDKVLVCAAAWFALIVLVIARWISDMRQNL